MVPSSPGATSGSGEGVPSNSTEGVPGGAVEDVASGVGEAFAPGYGDGVVIGLGEDGTSEDTPASGEGSKTAGAEGLGDDPSVLDTCVGLGPPTACVAATQPAIQTVTQTGTKAERDLVTAVACRITGSRLIPRLAAVHHPTGAYPPTLGSSTDVHEEVQGRFHPAVCRFLNGLRRIHPERLPNVTVGVSECAVVHEAEILHGVDVVLAPVVFSGFEQGIHLGPALT